MDRLVSITGKWDVYSIGEDKLVMIATDRISAFDVVSQGSPTRDRC